MELINVATKGGGGGGVVKCAFRGALLLHPPQFCCSTRLEAIGGKRVELSGASSRYGALIISQKQQQAPRNQTCSGFKLQEAQGVDDEEFGHGNVGGVAGGNDGNRGGGGGGDDDDWSSSSSSSNSGGGDDKLP
ncbi:unnamed protein product [Sphagnum balticum]